MHTLQGLPFIEQGTRHSRRLFVAYFNPLHAVHVCAITINVNLMFSQSCTQFFYRGKIIKIKVYVCLLNNHWRKIIHVLKCGNFIQRNKENIKSIPHENTTSFGHHQASITNVYLTRHFTKYVNTYKLVN